MSEDQMVTQLRQSRDMWRRIARRQVIAIVVLCVCAIAIAVTGLSPHVPASQPAPEVECPLPVDFHLEPAPPGETPLQRWKRTKADYDRAQNIEQGVTNFVQRQTTGLAIMPYVDAEKALQAAQCGQVCAEEKRQ